MKEIVTFFLLFVLLAAPAYAASADYGVGVSQKFGRGFLNVVSSPLEIPCTLRDEVSAQGGGGVATGFFKGIAFFVRRVLVGITEVGTFMIPMEATLPAVCAQKAKPAIQA